jgi:glycosyltransferase involved in cell wall biosynthesis
MQRGFEITCICAPSAEAQMIRERGAALHTAPLRRSIAPLDDLRAVWNLWRFLRRQRFDIIEVSTPKAALVGAIAARLAGARCIIHLIRGLAYQFQTGLSGRILRWSTAIPCRLAHFNVSVSHSMREQLHTDGVCDRERIAVLGEGSSNGVDLRRFDHHDRSRRDDIRRRFDIPADAVVAGFVGRITGDKGIVELVEAFKRLTERCPNLYLLLIGRYEERDRPPEHVEELIDHHPRIRLAGWQTDTAPFYQAFDIFVLPSFREGLANTLLEAGAMGLPTVTTDAIGCRDVVRDGQTGFCTPIRDVARLAEGLATLVQDARLRNEFGAAARRWVEANYDQRKVWDAQLAFMQNCLQKRSAG